ncbi:hypothetical protein JMUB7509_28060 [Staphylococcus aureus]
MPGVMSAPGVDAVTNVRVGSESPSTGTARKAFNCARKPGVEALARLLAVTAC